MKRLLFILPVLALPALAETLMLWDSSSTSAPPSTIAGRVVDVANTNHPDFRIDYRRAVLPALWDTDSGGWAAWTGSVTGTVDVIDSRRDDKRTPAQRAAMQDLIAAGQTFGLTARQVRRSPVRVLRRAYEASTTNTTATATRTLARTLAALTLIQTAEGDL